MRARFAMLSVGFPIGLFLGMMLFLEFGRRMGLSQAAKYGEASRVGIGVADGAVYALLALLLGFMFSGATTRFDNRRQLLVTQVTAIANAWHRLDTLPSAAQTGIRDGFRGFVDRLIAWYGTNAGSDEEIREQAALIGARNELWTRAIAACLGEGGEQSRMLVLPSLNEMFVAVEKERLARWIHPPAVMYVLLFVSALASSAFAGYSMANVTTRNWVFMVGIATTISLIMYFIIDIEYPRAGLVRIDKFGKFLVELRAKMG